MAPDKVRVLLVEDNPGDVRLLQETLAEAKTSHYVLSPVTDLRSALRRLAEEVFDVVLLDLMLPDSVGLDTFLRLREAAPSVPIVVLSALPDEHLALQAVQAGAQDYLVKGQTEAPLLERALRYAIERHRLARALEQARQRQQQEQELRSLDRLSHTAPAAVTAHLFGDAPLRQTAPEVFQAWVARYGSLLDMALEQRAYKVDHRLSAHLRTLAEELGFMHAGPRDVIDVHTQALHPKLRDVLPEKAQAYLEEGRMLVLELMGHLVAVYRVYALGRRSGGESRLAP